MNQHPNPQVSMLDPRTLQPNPWNTNSCSPAIEAKLDESVRRLGMFKPVVVRTLPDGSKQIIGGEHRSQSAIRVGLGKIPVCDLGDITEKRAKEISLVDNQRYGQDDSIQLAQLLEELGTAEDIGSFMPYSDAELTNIFSSVDIDLDSLDIDDGAVELPTSKDKTVDGNHKTHQTMRFRVPVEDVENIGQKFELIMKAQGFTEADSLTNAGDALVWLLNKVEV